MLGAYDPLRVKNEIQPSFLMQQEHTVRLESGQERLKKGVSQLLEIIFWSVCYCKWLTIRQKL